MYQFRTCTADGCGWSACKTDCGSCQNIHGGPCFTYVSCTAGPDGCNLNQHATGSSCMTWTGYAGTPQVCNPTGDCRWYQCEGRTSENIFCGALTGVTDATTLGDNNPSGSNYYYCSGGQRCYLCSSGKIYNTTTGRCQTPVTCTNTCTTEGQKVCDNNKLKTCTRQPSGCLEWVTTTCASGYCANAACCTPQCDASQTDCGTAIQPSNSCGTCTGIGNKCPNGQVCQQTGNTYECTASCTVTSCSNSTNPCSAIGTSNCGTSCTNIPATTCTTSTNQPGTCQAGSCVCTPSNACTGFTCGTAINNCGQTINCGTCNTGICTGNPGTCREYDFSLAYEGTLASIQTIQVPANGIDGSEAGVRIRGIPIAPAPPTISWRAQGYGRSVPAAFESYYKVTAPWQDAGKSSPTLQYLTISMYSGNTPVKSKNFAIEVTCAQGSACYCKQGEKAGCMLAGATNYATAPGYCPSDSTCGTCTSGWFSNGQCVECTSNDACQSRITDAECQTSACVKNTCQVTNLTTSCNNGLGTCNNGKCSQCTQSICDDRDTTVVVNVSKYQEGCTNITVQKQRTTTHLCVTSGGSSSCTPQPSTDLPLDNIELALPNGHPCANGVCIDGQCQPAICNQPHEEFCQSLNWQGNASVCNGIIEGICLNQPPCVNESFLDRSCSLNASGICVGQATCRTKCLASDSEPGCRDPDPNAELKNMVDNGLACERKGNIRQLCYECSPGYVFRKAEGQCSPSSYLLEVTTSSAVASEDILIVATLKDPDVPVSNANHEFVFRLTTNTINQESFDQFNLRIDEPGTYPVTITAFKKITGEPLATSAQTLSVACPDGNPCCPAGSTARLPEGSTCFQDGLPGLCRDNSCETTCKPRSGEETGRDDLGRDRCNNGIDDDCNGQTDCHESSCADSCRGITCDPGRIICSDTCVNLRSDNLNCGACGSRCRPNERCTESVCVEVPGCDVICNTDAECGRGLVCINAGDCTKSFCAKPNVIPVNQTTIDDITEQIIQTKTYKVVKELRGDRLQLKILNLAPLPLHNFTLSVNIPKDIAQTASDLAADQVFRVIDDDPVIEFSFDEISARQDILIELPRTVDAGLVNSVYVTGRHDPVIGTPSVLNEEAVTITSNYITEDGKTRILLGIDPHAQLYGVRIPVQIPKCIAASAKELKLNGDYEIVQDDPLVVWTFDSLTSKETLEIEVTNDVTESCKSALTAFAVADTVDKPINPWMPLLIIPVLGVILVFFQRFHAGSVEERLTRKEFERLAREQGESQEQIDEAWKEYEKKF